MRSRADKLDYLRSVQMVFQTRSRHSTLPHTIRHHLERPLMLHKKLHGAALNLRWEAVWR